MRRLLTIFLAIGIVHVHGQQSFSSTAKATAEKNHAEFVYTLADRMAIFPGGPSGWDKYIRKYLDYAVPLKNNAPRGRYNVIVSFIINETGLTTDFQALTHHGFGMEEELIRVIEMGPRWIPAYQDGRAVKSYRKQPLTFTVR